MHLPFDSRAAALNSAELVTAIARNDLATFTALAFGTVQPGAKYLPNWHIAAIAFAFLKRRRKTVIGQELQTRVGEVQRE